MSFTKNKQVFIEVIMHLYNKNILIKGYVKNSLIYKYKYIYIGEMNMKKNKVKMLAVVLGIVTVVGLSGCDFPGKKASSSKSTSKAKTEAKASDNSSSQKYTYEEFSKIKTGMTYEETKKILGEGKLDSSDYGILIYKWKNKDSSEIEVSYGTDKKATTKSETKLDNDKTKVTKAQYDKIDGKQKYEDIKSLLGGEGTITKVTDTGNGEDNTYRWGNDEDGSITISFVSGYASVKSGEGLK